MMERLERDYSNVSNEEIKRRVRQCYTKLADSFDPRGYILNKLFEKGVITLKQKSKIGSIPEADNQGDELLQMLFNGSHPKAFVVFRETLAKDHPWLVDMIDTGHDTWPTQMTTSPTPKTNNYLTRADKLSYTSQDCIGGGGYGVVYRAQHSDWGTVAFKKIQAQVIDEAAGIQLKAEAEIHSKLNHPNILTFMALVFEKGSYGLVLEHMEHGAMDSYLASNTVEWKKKLELIHGVSLGMSYLHGRTPPVIHGDLKINNILIGSDLKAKVCDFGFSRWKEFSKSISSEKVRLGTVTHIPPENWSNPHLRKMEKFDVYGFGIFMWETMSQSVPFKGGNADLIKNWVLNGKRPDLSVIQFEVSEEAIQLMIACWQENKTNRPSFLEIKNALENEITRFKNQFQYTDCNLIQELSMGRQVQGVAWLDDKVFVLCLDTNTVFVYTDEDLQNRLESLEFQISGMKKPVDIAACKTSQSLFISDYDEKCLWKVPIPDKHLISDLQLSDAPSKMSIASSSGELLLLSKNTTEENVDIWFIDIYRTLDVVNLRRILLPKELKNPQHLIQTSTGHFVICYEMEIPENWHVPLISKLSRDGDVLHTFNSSLDHPVNLNWPFHLTIDEIDRIFVADHMNHRVIIFDSHLKHAQIVLTDRHRINLPKRLCYIPEKRVLIVGQRSDTLTSASLLNDGSVLVFQFS